MKNRQFFLLPILFAILVSMAGFYFFIYQKQTRAICLSDSEIANYQIIEKKEGGGEATVIVSNPYRHIPFTFEIDIINPNHYHPLEIHKCHVYASRSFNYDYRNKRPMSNYKAEIWRYAFNGKGESIILLGNISNGAYKDIFADDFRVDPSEKYMALERGILGQSDYALVIKDLKNLDNVIQLTHQDVKKINPDVELGSFNLGKWTEDGKYLLGTMFIGALDTAYILIEAGRWKIEVLSPPSDILGGAERATSFTGYIAYADFPTFFGIDIVAQQEQDEFRKEGREKHLYLYNLRTKEKELLASTKDPEQRFNIKWISDTELEYYLPSGERKIYRFR